MRLNSLEHRSASVHFTTRECGWQCLRSRLSLCVSGCVSVCLSFLAITCQGLELETSFLVNVYVFRICRSDLYIKVIWWRSRSQEQKSVSVYFSSSNFWIPWPTNFILVCRCIFRISRSRSSIKVMGKGQGYTSVTKRVRVVCLRLKRSLVLYAFEKYL